MFGRFKELLYICIVKYVIMANDEELLVKILKHSHEQIMSGKSYSQDEVERCLDYIKNTWLSEQTMLERMGYFW